MSTNIRKTTKGVSFDKDLLDISDELLPNRSKAAQNGLLEAVMEKIETLNSDLQAQYKSRIKHLLD